jgi:hypothetical protein
MLNEPLLRALGVVVTPDHPSELHFVQCSSSLATGAIILHGFVSNEKTARVVVKTARNPQLPHSLEREWQSLAEVRRDAALAACTAEGIATFEVDDMRFFAYSGVPGRTMAAVFRNRLWVARATLLQWFAARALDMALRVHRSASQLAPAAIVADDVGADLEWLRRSVPLLPQSVLRKANEAAEVIAVCPKPLPHGRVHGDFSPHNLMIESNARRGTTRIIDWEHMESARPQHLDIFRFIGASLLLGKRGAERPLALQSMRRDAGPFIQNLLHPWLAALGADATSWTRPERLEALWWHYWVHATRRGLERLATADPRDSLLLRGMVELANQ